MFFFFIFLGKYRNYANVIGVGDIIYYKNNYKFGPKNEQNGTKKSPYSKGLICVNYSDKLLITPIHFVVVNIFSVFLACNSQYLIWTVGF